GAWRPGAFRSRIKLRGVSSVLTSKPACLAIFITRSRSSSNRISLCCPACNTCIQTSILTVVPKRNDGYLKAPAPALVLFDIDGTLIRRAGPHHREVLVDAVRLVTGIE